MWHEVLLALLYPINAEATLCVRVTFRKMISILTSRHTSLANRSGSSSETSFKFIECHRPAHKLSRSFATRCGGRRRLVEDAVQGCTDSQRKVVKRGHVDASRHDGHVSRWILNATAFLASSQPLVRPSTSLLLRSRPSADSVVVLNLAAKHSVPL